ncbi:SCA7, zinc-binding domain-containing protein [Irpex rosettiformis]|uniref:SCA7, zinc-binding domain-containing protein n=1 Tax=Irpex rosettiformis TaxID=378272 RepID=A0ACB8UBK5_9APHY|nr:SCA7, zinc-binding domain-containing protein [Irpex rosettiformis]
MTLKLKPSPSPPPESPFAWDKLPSSPTALDTPSDPSSPPTQWLSAKDMKIFGASPLSSTVGLVRCKDCEKPVMRSAMAEHAESCAKIRAAEKKAGKGKADSDVNKNKKRKAEDEDPTPDDPSAPKKKKPATKVTKGRVKGPVDLDQHCGVINDKGLPCSRSLTCKTHSMGAKRAVLGRSRDYDELLLEWNRLKNPNFVEPVKRESKAAKKERKEKEKAEKKRVAQETAIAAGQDPNAKKSSGAGGSGTKKKKATGAAATATVTIAGVANVTKVVEDIDDVDSEEELDHLSSAMRLAQDMRITGVPLAVPTDSSSWFVARRERIRTCKELLATALMPSRPSAVGVTMGPGRI